MTTVEDIAATAVEDDREDIKNGWNGKIDGLWDIDSLLQDSGKKVEGKSAADSDDDEMDMDTDNIPPKSSKGTKRKNNGRAQGLDTTSDFFADL
ncbi:hypothetical protein R6Q59_019980 [Mikania micrantha]